MPESHPGGSAGSKVPAVSGEQSAAQQAGEQTPVPPSGSAGAAVVFGGRTWVCGPLRSVPPGFHRCLDCIGEFPLAASYAPEAHAHAATCDVGPEWLEFTTLLTFDGNPYPSARRHTQALVLTARHVGNGLWWMEHRGMVRNRRTREWERAYIADHHDHEHTCVDNACPYLTDGRTAAEDAYALLPEIVREHRQR